MKKFVFPDTSIFLYFHSLDQIDLAQVLQSDSIEVVIAPTVLEELERQGWDHPQLGIRKRAQYSLRKARVWLQMTQGLIRPGVEVTLSEAPKAATFKEYNLDIRNRDDLLIAIVLEYSQSHGEGNVLLLTHDVRRQLKAHRYHLQSMDLPAEAMFPHAQPELWEEGAELRPEPTQQPSYAPLIDLRFDNGSRMLDVHSKEEEPLTAEVIAARLDELRVWCQEPLRFRESRAKGGLDEREAASMLANALLIPEQEFARYRHELDAFLQSCDEWLHRRAEMMDSLRRTVRLDFELVNLGSAAAEGLVLILALPRKLRWLETLGNDGMPQEPRMPTLPRTHMELVRDSISELARATVPPLSAGFEQGEVLGSDGWLMEGQELRGLVDLCPQHGSVKLPAAYAMFVDPEAMSTFAISYVINERNSPEPVDGRLLVRVR
jgi:hypothetical protein